MYDNNNKRKCSVDMTSNDLSKPGTGNNDNNNKRQCSVDMTSNDLSKPGNSNFFFTAQLKLQASKEDKVVVIVTIYGAMCNWKTISVS